VQPALGSAPTGFAQWLSALDFALGEPREIAIVGDGDAQKLLDVVFSQYRPNQVVAWGREDSSSPIPLLKGRTAQRGRATAYVCQHFTCRLPVTEPEALAAQLNG
jgi:uncharacterized protein YyaL (SSP411 family)